MKFTTTLTIAIADAEAEFAVAVEGDYQPYHRASVPRGEYMPLEPDEPEAFDVSSVAITHTVEKIRVKIEPPLDVTHLLSPAQIAGLADLGIEAAAAEREENDYRMAEARAEARQEWADMRDERDEL